MSLSAFVLVDAILLIGNHTISEYLLNDHPLTSGFEEDRCPTCDEPRGKVTWCHTFWPTAARALRR